MRRAQLQHPFNWILVIIAGAFFLLLFISIMKSVSDTGAGFQEVETVTTALATIENTRASPGTTVTARLPDTRTTCTDTYRMQLSRQDREIELPVFSPPLIRGETTIWSEELVIGDPITTLTYLLPEETTIYATAGVPAEVTRALPRVQRIEEPQSLSPRTDHTILIASQELEGITIDTAEDVDAIVIDGDQARYYHHDNGFIQTGTARYTTPELRTAAILSTSKERYECGLRQAEKRLGFLASLGRERTERLRDEGSWPAACTNAYTKTISAYEGLADARLDEPIEGYQRTITLQRQSLISNGCPA